MFSFGQLQIRHLATGQVGEDERRDMDTSLALHQPA